MAEARLMPRDLAARLGRETVEILRRGHYRIDAGCQVGLADSVKSARSRTVSYAPDVPLASFPPGNTIPSYEVTNATTLEVARRMTTDGHAPGVLNFASATHPGGGFLNGARAQEESIARSSGLYACLEGDPFYQYHNGPGFNEHFYSHYAIYSPDVPVFRLDDGTLLREPWPCSIVTCAAVMASSIMATGRYSADDIETTMRDRTRRVLQIFRQHGHRHLLLGAWGCGAFGGDSSVMARLFKEALEGEFRGQFERVVFGITDWSEERRFIGPFEEIFNSPEVC